MRSKLHLGILITLIAFIARFLEPTAAPNQQIVVQFADTHITEVDAQVAIEAIQLKLEDVGAERIEIGHNQQGQLIITYFSDTDVERVQQLLAVEDALQIASNSNQNSNNFPVEETLKSFKLDVSEIQKSNDSDTWGFDGVQITETNQKSDRFNNLDFNVFGTTFNQNAINNLFSVALRIHSNTVFEIKEASYKIPEVRAGPVV